MPIVPVIIIPVQYAIRIMAASNFQKSIEDPEWNTTEKETAKTSCVWPRFIRKKRRKTINAPAKCKTYKNGLKPKPACVLIASDFHYTRAPNQTRLNMSSSLLCVVIIEKHRKYQDRILIFFLQEKGSKIFVKILITIDFFLNKYN